MFKAYHSKYWENHLQGDFLDQISIREYLQGRSIEHLKYK